MTVYDLKRFYQAYPHFKRGYVCYQDDGLSSLTDEEKRQIYTIGKIEKELMKLIGKVAG